VKTADDVLAYVGIPLEVAWMLYVLARGSDAGLPVLLLLVLVWGGLVVVVLWVVRVVVHLRATRTTPEARRLRRLSAELALMFLCFGAVWTGTAFRARFVVSKPALARFVTHQAQAIGRGHFTPGIRVGLFRIREAEALPGGVVRLITTDCMFDDCGLAYSPAGEPPVVGEDTYSPLGKQWWQWWRSW
jgi:hypothetical protein